MFVVLLIRGSPYCDPLLAFNIFYYFIHSFLQIKRIDSKQHLKLFITTSKSFSYIFIFFILNNNA